ncbi:hypothetical protein [Nitratireductor aestuarii]|uniref:hypothetical protein n=1 Tax=Nitratireductor aestuarii TaxID=1735103 RepID=UPI0016650FF9|nr:hypothetical protein [Nitratireductor aestuarii]
MSIDDDALLRVSHLIAPIADCLGHSIAMRDRTLRARTSSSVVTTARGASVSCRALVPTTCAVAVTAIPGVPVIATVSIALLAAAITGVPAAVAIVTAAVSPTVVATVAATIPTAVSLREGYIRA